MADPVRVPRRVLSDEDRLQRYRRELASFEQALPRYDTENFQSACQISIDDIRARITELESINHKVTMIPSLEPYHDFLANKHIRHIPTGFPVELDNIHPTLFPFQQAIVRWNLHAGCSGLFADTGLGKSRMEIEWSKHVADHTGGKVLILTPLAVAFQFLDEAAALDVPLTYVRSQAEADAAESALVITNYDRLADFDATRFTGVVLDESSILANYTGKTKQLLETMFKPTPFKLAASATPAPNDFIELGNQSAFLGIKHSHEMLSDFFVNDTMKAGGYRLRGHAAEDFWQWVASWAVCVTHPRDIGFDTPGYDLPELDIQQHVVGVDHSRAWEKTDRYGQSRMFIDAKQSATGMWGEKHATLDDRCRMAADLITSERGEAWAVWASTEEESKALAKLIPGAVEVRGSMKLAEKEARLKGFAAGDIPVLITKTKIASMGLNWQHCARMCFVSPTFSFKDAYQGIRRIYRFRQQRACHVHFVLAETEANIAAAIARKEEQHREMQRELTKAMQVSGLLATQRDHRLKAYQPITTAQHIPAWLRRAA